MQNQPNPPKKVDARPAGAQRGFALVVTLSLMILLTVIAVGLLSLSSISLRASTQGEAMQTARSNARLALMLAIGQLQREMGPDSKISAPSDAGPIATGGNPKWTAVYDAWKADPDKTKLTVLTPESRVPKFRSWLVSGADGTSVASGETVPLVGARSLGMDPEDPEFKKVENLVSVSAPLVRLSDLKKQGGMAWWTADESAKAKINAGAAAESLAEVSSPLADAQSPVYTGPRAIPQLSAFEWKPKQRSSAVTTGAVNLAAGLSSPGIGRLSHDITVYSLGVLSDVREGRLRRDLSNLLTRPIEEVEDKPLYLADGRMNRFLIDEKGSVSNGPGLPANERLIDGGSSGPGRLRTKDGWGINLEELYLFHNMHREIDWVGGLPRIVSKSDRLAAATDRFFLYRRPTIDAAQFILSLLAFPDKGKYQMRMMIDGMIAVSNPNDVAFEYAPGLQLPVHIERIPYELKWDIKGSAPNSTTVTTTSLQVFRAYVGGGPEPSKASGFTLEPGESGAFGSTKGSGYIQSVGRGFDPPITEGVWMKDFDLKAAGLGEKDTINFTMTRQNDARSKSIEFGNSPVWSTCSFWLGPRAFGAQAGWPMGGITPYNSVPNSNLLSLPQTIRPSRTESVSFFVGKRRPFLLLSYVRNVEQDSSGIGQAFPSRAHLLSEPASGNVGMSMSDLKSSLHMSQCSITAEQLPFSFQSLAAGAGGRNLYHGGSRQSVLGGSLYVIKRRIPLAPPLSLGAFENAIASGFARRFQNEPPIVVASGTPSDPFPANARTLSGLGGATPVVAKAIGNSFASPFIPPDRTFLQPALPNGGSDHSWMVNNALWDSWFLSGIVDFQPKPGAPSWLRTDKDKISPKSRFKEFAEGTGLLRNQRFLFHPHKPADKALDELFTGDNLKPSAINDLSKYLLVDGVFNVNSTSAAAWKGLLTSVREQELIVGSGKKESFKNPYGTLGYAQDKSTTSDWSGLRDLSEPDIDSLSKAIVDEVKARGPFLNLGDFVNRRPNGAAPEQAVGALQAAIDKSGLNNRFTTIKRSLAATDFGVLPGKEAITAESARARAAGSAGHLTQARLLTALGPQITVRSDTFLVRAYGDARDASGKIVLAKAWCEAVVQRVPEYVDPTDRPEAAEGWPTSSYKLTTSNFLFGRRMEIRSFRWLSSNEI